MIDKSKYYNNPKWLPFTVDRFGENWALCRKTKRNLRKYGRCVSQKEWNKAIYDFIQSTI